MIRILFCNISYLLYYNTRLDRVAPKNGGAYVAKMHDAYRFFNIQADRKDGFLLPEDQRTFVVPRARQDGIGFGQANIWYAGTPECSEYVNKVIRYIESHA